MPCFHNFHKHHCLFSNTVTKGHIKKCTNPYNHVSAVVETSLLCPQNVRFFNSKLGWVVERNQTIN